MLGFLVVCNGMWLLEDQVFSLFDGYCGQEKVVGGSRTVLVIHILLCVCFRSRIPRRVPVNDPG